MSTQLLQLISSQEILSLQNCQRWQSDEHAGLITSVLGSLNRNMLEGNHTNALVQIYIEDVLWICHLWVRETEFKVHAIECHFNAVTVLKEGHFEDVCPSNVSFLGSKTTRRFLWLNECVFLSVTCHISCNTLLPWGHEETAWLPLLLCPTPNWLHQLCLQ